MSAVLVILAAAGCTTETNNGSITNTSTENTSTAQTVAPSATETYQNLSYGVKFTYPQSWVRSGPPTTQGTSTIYCRISPRAANSTITAMNFRVENRSTFEGGSDAATSLNSVTQFATEMKTGQSYQNVTVQGPTETTLGGLPAYKLVMSYDIPSQSKFAGSFREMTIISTHGNFVYWVSYYGPSTPYNQSLTGTEQIINSFKFI